MQKDRDQRRQHVDRIAVDDARETRPERERESHWRLPRELPRHHAELAHRHRHRRWISGTLNEKPHGDGNADEQPRHPRRVERRVLVAERYHVRESGDWRPAGPSPAGVTYRRSLRHRVPRLPGGRRRRPPEWAPPHGPVLALPPVIYGSAAPPTPP